MGTGLLLNDGKDFFLKLGGLPVEEVFPVDVLEESERRQIAKPKNDAFATCLNPEEALLLKESLLDLGPEEIVEYLENLVWYFGQRVPEDLVQGPDKKLEELDRKFYPENQARPGLMLITETRTGIKTEAEIPLIMEKPNQQTSAERGSTSKNVLPYCKRKKSWHDLCGSKGRKRKNKRKIIHLCSFF